MRTSSQSHDGIHLKILLTHFEVFLRHSNCYSKTFYESYDKIYKFSNFKCDLVSQFNNLQDPAT